MWYLKVHVVDTYGNKALFSALDDWRAGAITFGNGTIMTILGILYTVEITGLPFHFKCSLCGRFKI